MSAISRAVIADTVRSYEPGNEMKLPPAPSFTQTGQSDPRLALLARLLLSIPEVEFAVLVGSRAQGTAQANSDWDIALQWRPQSDWLVLLGLHETLRRRIADILGTSQEEIDLIDLSRANLAMRASVAEDGIVLKGEESLAWARFLTRTWRELEDYYWERAHAA